MPPKGSRRSTANKKKEPDQMLSGTPMSPPGKLAPKPRRGRKRKLSEKTTSTENIEKTFSETLNEKINELPMDAIIQKCAEEWHKQKRNPDILHAFCTNSLYMFDFFNLIFDQYKGDSTVWSRFSTFYRRFIKELSDTWKNVSANPPPPEENPAARVVTIKREIESPVMEIPDAPILNTATPSDTVEERDSSEAVDRYGTLAVAPPAAVVQNSGEMVSSGTQSQSSSNIFVPFFPQNRSILPFEMFQQQTARTGIFPQPLPTFGQPTTNMSSYFAGYNQSINMINMMPPNNTIPPVSVPRPPTNPPQAFNEANAHEELADKFRMMSKDEQALFLQSIVLNK